MTQLLDEAVDALERRLFFDQFVARFDELRSDAGAWAEEDIEAISDERLIAASASRRRRQCSPLFDR